MRMIKVALLLLALYTTAMAQPGLQWVETYPFSWGWIVSGSGAFAINQDETAMVVFESAGEFRHPSPVMDWIHKGYVPQFYDLLTQQAIQQEQQIIVREPGGASYTLGLEVVCLGPSGIVAQSPQGLVDLAQIPASFASVAISPDGKLLACSRQDGGLSIYSLDSCQEVNCFDQGGRCQWTSCGGLVFEVQGLGDTADLWFWDSLLGLVQIPIAARAGMWEVKGEWVLTRATTPRSEGKAVPTLVDLETMKVFCLDTLPPAIHLTSLEVYAPGKVMAIASGWMGESGIYSIDLGTQEALCLYPLPDEEVYWRSTLVVHGENVYASYGEAIHKLRLSPGEKVPPKEPIKAP